MALKFAFVLWSCFSLFLLAPAQALTQKQLQDRTLGRALRQGDLSAIETFLAEQKTDLNQTIFISESLYLRPLSLALLHTPPRYRLDTLDLLLRLGAPLNYQEIDLKSSTPLHLVLRYLPADEAVLMIQYLLTQRADGNLFLRDQEALTPAELAQREKSPAAEFLKKFQPSGLSNMNLVHSPMAYQQGKLRLKEYALVETCIAAITEKTPEALKTALQAGADPNARLQDEKASPMLFWALDSRSPILVQILLAAGARTDLQDNQGNQALHQSVLVGQPALLKYILQTQPDLNQRNQAGFAPLHLAVQSKNLPIITLLLDAGAAVQLPNGAGQSALEMLGSDSDPLALQIRSVLQAKIKR